MEMEKKKITLELAVVAHTYNPSTQEAEIEVSLGYPGRSCLKRQTTNKAKYNTVLYYRVILYVECRFIFFPQHWLIYFHIIS